MVPVVPALRVAAGQAWQGSVCPQGRGWGGQSGLANFQQRPEGGGRAGAGDTHFPTSCGPGDRRGPPDSMGHSLGTAGLPTKPWIPSAFLLVLGHRSLPAALGACILLPVSPQPAPPMGTPWGCPPAHCPLTPQHPRGISHALPCLQGEPGTAEKVSSLAQGHPWGV